MLSGQLVWVGDHFAPSELEQLRTVREQKALDWLSERLANTSGNTSAAVIVLVIPEEAIEPGVLLPVHRVRQIAPPLGFGDGPNGVDAEGRYFTSNTRPGRALILRNGVVEGVAWLNAHTVAQDRVNLEALHADVENNISHYLEMQRGVLHLTGRAWLMLSLGHADGLEAIIPGTGRVGTSLIAAPWLRLPELHVDTSPGGAQADKVVESAVRRLVEVVVSAFGL